MNLKPEGWVQGARRVLSPNRDERPAGVEICLLLVHAISLPPGEYGGDAIERLFTNRLDWSAHPYFEQIRGLEVSAHFLVRRDGATLQFVSIADRAWHAGRSAWRGRENCNDFSVGIELEGMDDLPYAEAQYRALGQLIVALRRGYPSLRRAEVVGHSDIAPGRKTDPGPAFDWSLLERELAAAGAT
jgi:N-acetyl-anhydromuramoyl-L-alanine amidase